MNVADVLKLSAPTQKKQGNAHLRVRLDADTPVAIALEAAQAAVTISTQRITPVPNMPKHILGLVAKLGPDDTKKHLISLLCLLSDGPILPSRLDIHHIGELARLFCSQKKNLSVLGLGFSRRKMRS